MNSNFDQFVENKDRYEYTEHTHSHFSRFELHNLSNKPMKSVLKYIDYNCCNHN